MTRIEEELLYNLKIVKLNNILSLELLKDRIKAEYKIKERQKAEGIPEM